MNYLLIIISILFLLQITKTLDSFYKRILYPYYAIWAVALIVASSGAYDLKVIRSTTVLLLLLHLYAFTFGFLLKKSDKNIENSSWDYILVDETDLLLHNKKFQILIIALTSYILFNFAKFSSALIMYSSLAELRGDYFADELLGAGYKTINGFILSPFKYVVITLFSIRIFYKRDLWCVIFIVYLFAYSILSGGRGEFINIIFGILFIGFCVGSSISTNLKKANIPLMAMLGVILYFTISWITLNREESTSFSWDALIESTNETNTQIVEYIGGPSVAFDIAVNDEFNYGYKRTYGTMTFACVDEIIYYISILTNNVLHSGIHLRSYSEIGNFLHENKVDVGSTGGWNALYTSCLYYYLDLGYLGLILIPCLLGYMIRGILNKIYSSFSLAYIILGCLFFVSMMSSVLRIFMYRIGYALIIIYMLYLGRKNKT